MKDKIQVGRILNTHGIKGEVKVLPLTDDITRFEGLSKVYVEGQLSEFEIERIWYKGNYVVVKFRGYNNINDVIKFKEKFLLINEEDAVKLPENTFFIYQLIGLTAFTVEGERLGKVVEVLQPGGNDVYVVKEDMKEYLIPAIKEIVKKIDLEKKEIIIDPIEGMIE